MNPKNQINQKNQLECPFCGNKSVNGEEFEKRTGMEIEKVIHWNGEAKIVLQLGAKIYAAQERNGEDTLDKERLFQLFEEEQKELEEAKKNIAKEQKERFEELSKKELDLEQKRKELEKSREELQTHKQEQIESFMEEKEKLHQEKEELLKSKAELIPKEVKELLEKQFARQDGLFNKLIHNPKAAGNWEETQVLRRLKAQGKPDEFEHLGGPNQEDLLVKVVEDGKQVGKIRIDCKRVEEWKKEYIPQMQRYIRKEGVEFAIISTKTMPKEAAGSDFHTTQDILIVNENFVEVAYLAFRYLLIKNHACKADYQTQVNLFKQKKTMLDKVKDVLDNTDFKKHLSQINKEIEKSNATVDKLEKNVKSNCANLKKSNGLISQDVDLALEKDQKLQKVLSST
ncbi:MAG: hypothetical protein AABX70_04685 [Nanoarchaeota archaeon]